jgi:hypothetical protein
VYTHISHIRGLDHLSTEVVTFHNGGLQTGEPEMTAAWLKVQEDGTREADGTTSSLRPSPQSTTGASPRVQCLKNLLLSVAAGENAYPQGGRATVGFSSFPFLGPYKSSANWMLPAQVEGRASHSID